MVIDGRWPRPASLSSMASIARESGPSTRQRGRGHTLNGKRQPPDALFCGNDQIARGAADALREKGIQVPQGVAIVGFDNWDVMVARAVRL